MPQEVEIKLRIENPKLLLRSLKKLGVTPCSVRVHEQNLLFDTPDGGLAKHGQLLRIRTEMPAPAGKKSRKKSPTRALLTFKSPPEQLAMGATAAVNRQYKVREETELDLADPTPLQKIFEGLGLKGWFRYEKFRTAYRLPARLKWARGLVLDFDETPIGTFLELEGPGPAIDQAARTLGFTARDYITKNYLVLYLENCKRQGVQPTHMLFYGER